jgi:hypothetical protein
MKLEKYANDMENLVHKRTANLQQRTLELEEERARTQTLLKGIALVLFQVKLTLAPYMYDLSRLEGS